MSAYTLPSAMPAMTRLCHAAGLMRPWDSVRTAPQAANRRMAPPSVHRIVLTRSNRNRRPGMRSSLGGSGAGEPEARLTRTFQVRLRTPSLVFGPDADELAVLDLADADLRVGAVAGLIAGQRAGDALEALGGHEGIPQRGARDVRRPTIRERHLLDRRGEHVVGVVRMGMEDADRLILTGNVRVSRKEFRLVEVAGEGEVRAGEDVTLGGVPCGVEPVGAEVAVGTRQDRIFQSRRFTRLLRHQGALGDEDREGEELGRGG